MRRSSGTVARSCQILATLVWGLLVFSAGCNECSPGEIRCKGDVYGACTADGDGPFATSRWVEATCPVACRVIAGLPTCVGATEPVAACVGATHQICFDGVPSLCMGGYPIHRTPCGAPTHCAVSPTCGAICAVDDAPDPRCSARPFCDGGRLNTCSCDLVVSRVDCGAADQCREMNGESVCTRSSTPDPRCGDPSQHESGFCADGTAFSCWFGFVAGAFNCGTNRCIERPGQYAACELPVSTPQ